MSGMEGICPNCGVRYYGWALDEPQWQHCDQCGTMLDIERDGVVYPSGQLVLRSAVEIEVLSSCFMFTPNSNIFNN